MSGPILPIPRIPDGLRQAAQRGRDTRLGEAVLRGRRPHQPRYQRLLHFRRGVHHRPARGFVGHRQLDLIAPGTRPASESGGAQPSPRSDRSGSLLRNAVFRILLGGFRWLPAPVIPAAAQDNLIMKLFKRAIRRRSAMQLAYAYAASDAEGRCCMIQLRREWGRFSNFSFRTPQRRISAYPARPSG